MFCCAIIPPDCQPELVVGRSVWLFQGRGWAWLFPLVALCPGLLRPSDEVCHGPRSVGGTVGDGLGFLWAPVLEVGWGLASALGRWSMALPMCICWFSCLPIGLFLVSRCPRLLCLCLGRLHVVCGRPPPPPPHWHSLHPFTDFYWGQRHICLRVLE